LTSRPTDPDGPTTGPVPEVRDDAEQQRYEAVLDGQLAGVAEYVLDGGRIVFTHTEVDPAFGGRGVGGALVEAAVADATGRGLAVAARCPFVARWLAEHPLDGAGGRAEAPS